MGVIAIALVVFFLVGSNVENTNMITGWVVGSCPEEFDSMSEVKEARLNILNDFKANRGNGKYTVEEVKDFSSWYRTVSRSPEIDCSQTMKTSGTSVNEFMNVKLLGKAPSEELTKTEYTTTSNTDSYSGLSICPEEYDTKNELKQARKDILKEYKSKSDKYDKQEVREFTLWYKTAIKSDTIDCSVQIESTSMSVGTMFNTKLLGKTDSDHGSSSTNNNERAPPAIPSNTDVCPEEYDSKKELKQARSAVMQEYKAKSGKYDKKEVKEFLSWYKTAMKADEIDCSTQLETSSMSVGTMLNTKVLERSASTASTSSKGTNTATSTSTASKVKTAVAQASNADGLVIIGEANSHFSEPNGQNVVLTMPAGMEAVETTDYIYAGGQLVAKVTEVTQ